MTTATEKISSRQLYALFFISRSMSLFTFIAPQQTAFPPGDRVLLFIPFCIFEILFALPFFIITKDFDGIIPLADKISPKLGKTVSFIYFLFFCWSGAMSVTRFELFMSTALFSDTDLTLMIIILFGVCIYIAAKGLQTLGRCAVAICSLLLLSTTAIILGTVKFFSFENLSPPFIDGIMPFIGNGFSAAARTPELVSLLFLKPEVSGNIKKGLFVWSVLFGIFACTGLCAAVGVMGNFCDLQMFQLYELTVVADFGIFEKADALLTGLWVFCIIFRTSFFIFLAVTAAKNIVNLNKYLLLSLSAALMFTAYIFSSKSTEIFSGLLTSGINEIIYTVATVIIPTVLFFIFKAGNKLKEKRGIML